MGEIINDAKELEGTNNEYIRNAIRETFPPKTDPNFRPNGNVSHIKYQQQAQKLADALYKDGSQKVTGALSLMTRNREGASDNRLIGDILRNIVEKTKITFYFLVDAAIMLLNRF